jgi:hypothetical protein
VDSTGSLESYQGVERATIGKLVRHNYEAVLIGLDERRRPVADEDGTVFAEAGEARARQGVAIREMLALWRIGLENLHELARNAAPDGSDRDPLLLEFLELALAWDDFAMVHAAEGHRRGELGVAREQQHAQTNCVRRVLSGVASSGELTIAFEPLGLDPATSYHAVRARPLPMVDIGAIEAYLRADGLVSHGNGLIALVDGDACGFVATLPQSAAPLAVGCSEPVPLSQMERAFERATRALETALRLGVKGTFQFSELGIHPAIAEDREVGDQMLARYVEPLLKNQGGATVLTTVQHFLANDRNVDLTASELGVHPNTVRQRLERFEEATGRSTRDTETLVELWWALERHRLA